MDAEKVLAVLRAFEQHGVEYLVVGAVAINFLGSPRATEDLDLFVRPSPENVERIKQALKSVWDDPSVDSLTVEDLAGEYAVVRYGPPDDGLKMIDLLGHIGEAFHFDDLQAQTVTVEDVHVQVATPASLYRMKRDTLRLKDKADALGLLERFPDLAKD